MRATVAASILLICGCSATSVRDQAHAQLNFVRGDAQTELPQFLRVDEQRVAAQPVTIAPGIHNIRYYCPGYIETEGGPEQRVKIRAGKRYDVSCKEDRLIVRRTKERE